MSPLGPSHALLAQMLLANQIFSTRYSFFAIWPATGGRLAFTVQARRSPRTVLGATNTTAEPTVLAARREMQSWISLQLEPTALRKPDDYGADSKMSPNGEHLAATLHRLGCPPGLANELAELLPDVREVLIDSDEGRRLRTLKVAGRDGFLPVSPLADRNNANISSFGSTNFSMARIRGSERSARPLGLFAARLRATSSNSSQDSVILTGITGITAKTPFGLATSISLKRISQRSGSSLALCQLDLLGAPVAF